MSLPLPPGPADARGSHRDGIARLLCCAVVLLLLFARRPDAFLTPQFWAEDAIIFHAQAETLGWRSLFRPEMGYHHAIPRLVALGTAHLIDAPHQPAAYNFAFVAIVLLFFASLAPPRWPGPPPLLFAATAVLIPQSGEIFCTLTNVQWVCALFLVLTATMPAPPSHAGRAAETLGLLLVGLTGPFSVVLLPLHLVRSIRFGRSTWLPTLALAVAAGLQGLALLQTARLEPTLPALARTSWLQIAGFRIFIQSLGRGRLAAMDGAFSTLCGGAGLALSGLLALVPGPARPLRLTLLAAAALIQAAVMFKMNPLRGMLFHPDTAPRYFYDARVLLLWLFLTIAWRPPHGALRALALGGLTCAGLVTISQFRLPALVDLHWAAHADKVRAGLAAEIPINPVPYVYHYAGRAHPTSLPTPGGVP